MYLFLLTLSLLFLPTPSLADAPQSISLFTSGEKHYEQNEYTLAQADWQKAADESDVQAMDKLAGMYANGEGVPIDYKKAIQYWQKAADKGDGDAMFQISVSYETARGVAADHQAGNSWLHKALDQCNIHAAARVLNTSSEQPELDKALACIEKNAQGGNYKAMLDLAGKDWKGHTVLKNPIEAGSWGDIAVDILQKKAAAGDTEAMFYLGRTFFGGEGDTIPKDTDRGLQWFEKAASLGDMEAISRLVAIYRTDAVYKDDKKADIWNEKRVVQYTLRAEKGDVNSMLKLAEEYSTSSPGTGGDANKAVAWTQKAAALGSRDALEMLGYIHEGLSSTKDGPLHDCKKSHDYYEKAAALGEQKATSRLTARAQGAQGLGCDF